jgi:hypothetical protein
MWPSNDAVARRSGLRGHQVVWNDQSLLGGSFCQRVANMGAHLSDDLAGLWVPAKGAVVFATGQEQVRILLAPGHRQDALLMAAEYLQISNGRIAATHSFRRSGVAEVPQHDDGRFVVLRGGDEARRLGQLAMLRPESLTCSGCQQTSLMPLRFPI